MTEVTSGAKIGIALMLLASVIVTIFCIYSIGSAAVYDYYEEQTELIDAGTAAEFEDLYYRNIPMPQMFDLLEANPRVFGVYVYYRINTDNNITNAQSNYRASAVPIPADMRKQFAHATGYVYDMRDRGNGLEIFVRVGAD